MKYFRHWPLTAWVLIVITLAGVLGYAYVTTRTAPVPFEVGSTLTSPAAARADVLAMRDALTVVPGLSVAGQDGREAWAGPYAARVRALADTRAVIAGDTDAVVAAYRRLAAAADTYGTTATPGDAIAAQLILFTRGDELVGVVDATLGLSGQPFILPQPSVPTLNEETR
jgi:hypothetical protein